jgi:hypothetical protein
MINALFYEISYRADGLDMLRNLLSACVLPFGTPAFEFRSATILVEQSFSDFGDADLVLLLDGDVRQCVFFEAKVKTDQQARWRLDREWAAFTGCLNENSSPSNLFVQLYRKQRLIDHVRQPGQVLLSDGVAPRWSLGNNRIVRRATDLLRPYTEHARFVALLPAPREEIAQFFTRIRAWSSPRLPAWSMDAWGYITWKDVHELCKRASGHWRHSLSVFDYNAGQIYDDSHGRPGYRDAPEPLAPWSAEDLDAFLRGLSPQHRQLLWHIVDAGGVLSQADMMRRLPFLGNDHRQLRAFKASINRAARAAGHEPLLPEGIGAGPDRHHRISSALQGFRALILEVCAKV